MDHPCPDTACSTQRWGFPEEVLTAHFSVLGPGSPVTTFLVNLARPKATRGMWGRATSFLCQVFFQIKEETPLNVTDL